MVIGTACTLKLHPIWCPRSLLLLQLKWCGIWGAEPVFVDCEPDTFCVSPELIEQAWDLHHAARPEKKSKP